MKVVNRYNIKDDKFGDLPCGTVFTLCLQSVYMKCVMSNNKDEVEYGAVDLGSGLVIRDFNKNTLVKVLSGANLLVR